VIVPDDVEPVMNDQQLRIALLTPQGQALKQLTHSLERRGAMVVVIADPLHVTEPMLVQSRPDVILVRTAQEVVTPFDLMRASFESKGIRVLFDDASLSGHLDGGELAAWADRLANDLVGDDVSTNDADEGDPEADDAPPVPEVHTFAGLKLSLVDEHSAPTVSGLVVVLAGMGGPDAVRRLLAGIANQPPVPILLKQALPNDRFDRLAEQLAKSSPSPVYLAEEGAFVEPGKVAVLPNNLGVVADGRGMRFASGIGIQALLRDLPARRSAIVVLSGADVDLVPDVLALGQAGAILMAHRGETCFDAAAAELVIASGAFAGDPEHLAQQLTRRWPG
jgi:chemotaxis response regulator CheB